MTARSRAPAAAALVAAALLTGCANLVFLAPNTEPEKVETPAATLERAEYRVEVQAPGTLRKLLTTYLDLSRFQNAPAAEGITAAELERLVRAAPAQARSLLETAGYFSADVRVERGPTQGSELPLLRVIVEPGPQARVAAFALDVHGALDDAVRRSDAAAVEELATLRRQWPLQPGSAFRQGAWTDAKNSTIAQLRARGYAAASWNETHARVDAPDNSVSLSGTIDSGPLYLIGEIHIEGLQRYDAEAVRKLANFQPGTPYTEKTLLDFQERVQKIGLFEGAAVELDANPETASAAPVLVKLKELPLQQATVGVGYSANTGPRLTFEHIHRRVFGSRWVAKNKFELGSELKSWGGELISHPLDGLYRNLVAGSASNLRSADQVLNSWSARVGRTQDTPRIERLYFFELTQASLVGELIGNRASALSYNYHWVYRDLDSVLLPTRGLTTSAQAAGGYARGSRTLLGVTETARGPFARLYVRMTWYQPFGDAWYATLRGEAGQVFTSNVIGIPETLLFRAGGDDSVRGYAYRTLGPTVGGVLSSGRTLLTASAEIARPISAKYPAIWWATFVDAGNAADRFSELRPALGYGVGVRWRSPVGPLRVDLAYGQETHKVRAHLSIGIAF
ncbi:MAG: BamA/TamA family outer membrane protein [Burkholderiales bacterium]